MLTDVLTQLPPITLEEMDAISLMNRIDTKYTTTMPVLEEILREAARCGYRALVTEGTNVCSYNSTYFDTSSLKMFLDHRNRKLTRQKVRTRVYLNSGLTFLEIKRKNNQGRTKKKRIPIPPEAFPDFRPFPEAAAYLQAQSAFAAEELSPSLETAFDRITLVNPEMTERLTIDTSVRFHNNRNGCDASLGDGVVIELKQDGRAMSRMKEILLGKRVKPVRVSKYCIGTVLTDPHCRPGRFKLKIRSIEKVIHKRLLPIC